MTQAQQSFEKVHPFGDGNGRIGRLLMNQILWFSGYPVLIIEYKNKNVNYKALDRNEDGLHVISLRGFLCGG